MKFLLFKLDFNEFYELLDKKDIINAFKIIDKMQRNLVNELINAENDKKIWNKHWIKNT